MPNVDIAVDADLQQLFQLPSCEDITIPAANGLSVQLPTGGALTAFAVRGHGWGAEEHQALLAGSGGFGFIPCL